MHIDLKENRVDITGIFIKPFADAPVSSTGKTRVLGYEVAKVDDVKVQITITQTNPEYSDPNSEKNMPVKTIKR